MITLNDSAHQLFTYPNKFLVGVNHRGSDKRGSTVLHIPEGFAVLFILTDRTRKHNIRGAATAQHSKVHPCFTGRSAKIVFMTNFVCVCLHVHVCVKLQNADIHCTSVQRKPFQTGCHLLHVT